MDLQPHINNDQHQVLVAIDLPIAASTETAGANANTNSDDNHEEQTDLDVESTKAGIRQIALETLRQTDWIGEEPNYSVILQRLLEADTTSKFIPDIRVLSGRVIRGLGRVPDYAEINPDSGMPYHISLREIFKYWKPYGAFKRPIINILTNITDLETATKEETEDVEELAMLDASKAPAISALSNYSKLCYEQEVFWITSVGCFDDKLVRNGVVATALMPLLIGLCDGLVCLYDGDDCEKDAWLALQRLVYASYKSPRGWKFIPFFQQLTSPSSESWIIPDPRTLAGSMSPEDRQFIDDMTKLCIDVWPTAKEMNWRAKTNVYSEWNCPEVLTPGTTAVFTWTMNYHCFATRKRTRQAFEDVSLSAGNDEAVAITSEEKISEA